jgi:hypothetical protein
MRLRRTTVITLAFTFICLGCNNVHTQYSGSHFWIYVPSPRIAKPRGGPAEVSLPSLPYRTNRMEIIVEGEVASPGVIKPPEGCTVLQAIGYAGGFTDFAFTRYLRLTRPTWKTLHLRLQARAKDPYGHRVVWYEASPSTTDFILKTGDRLHVPRPSDDAIDDGQRLNR